MRTTPLRQVRLDDWSAPEMLRVSLPARMTAMLLHLVADGHGRAVVDLPTLLARLYPRRDDPVSEADLEAHLLELADAGVLTLYTDPEGRELLEMTRPVGVNRRSPSRHPSPADPGCREMLRRPRRPVGMEDVGSPPTRGEDHSRTVMSAHGYGEREREMRESDDERARASGPSASDESELRERVRAPRAGAGREQAVAEATARELARHAEEQARRRREWHRWAAEQEYQEEPPEVPIELDAPPIGCPQHPSGVVSACGPCGTARRQRDLWLAKRRYEERLAAWAARKAAREIAEPPALEPEYEEVF